MQITRYKVGDAMSEDLSIQIIQRGERKWQSTLIYVVRY